MTPARFTCVAMCCIVLHCVVVFCSALQCVAVCCGVLHCVAHMFVRARAASGMGRLIPTWRDFSSTNKCCVVLHCVALCCSVLQCVAVCCSVLLCVAGFRSVLHALLVVQGLLAACAGSLETNVAWLQLDSHVLHCVVVCCSVLQRVAAWVRCSVVQPGCGAVWCSVVQCGAVWCNVVQCGAVCCDVANKLWIGSGPFKNPQLLCSWGDYG